jgi:hypothetical protein
MGNRGETRRRVKGKRFGGQGERVGGLAYRRVIAQYANTPLRRSADPFPLPGLDLALFFGD